MRDSMGDAEAIREAVRTLGRRRRTEAIPKDLRRRAMATARALRRRGESWRAVASEVGLSVGTVQRWLMAEPKGGFARVVVREPERVLSARGEAGNGGIARRGDTVVVLPNGVRVEGLAGADLIAVLRALA